MPSTAPSLVGEEVMIFGSGAAADGSRARVSKCIGDRVVLMPGSAIREVGLNRVLALPLAPSSEQYFNEHKLGFDTRVGDGFVDPGRMADAREMPLPEALVCRPPDAAVDREVLLVDARVDKCLRERVEQARAELQPITDKRDRIKRLGSLVSNWLGDLPRDLDEKCEREISALVQAKGSMLVPLGDISHGVCRHRALLFKVLCDAVGIECALLRGDLSGATSAEAHAWNVVHVYGSAYIVDLMHKPGEIYQREGKKGRKRYCVLAERGAGESEEREDGIQSLPAPSPRPQWHVRSSDVVYERRRADGAKVLLGSGSSGRVYAGRLKVSQPVAIKRLNAAGADARSEFEREVAILHQLRHPHIVLFYGACGDDPDNLIIVTERMHGGSLSSALEKDPTRVAWAAAGGRIALHVAYALHYLHTLEPPVVHYDVKPENVLLIEDYSLAKLADVGVARTKLGSRVTARGHTPEYAAPEVKAGRKANEKADIYSFGVLVGELLTQQQPRGRARPRLPDETPAEVRELAKSCLNKKAALRPSASDLVATLESAAAEAARAAAAVRTEATPPSASEPLMECEGADDGAGTENPELAPAGGAAAHTAPHMAAQPSPPKSPDAAAAGPAAAPVRGEAELAAMGWAELCTAICTASDPAAAECALRVAVTRTASGASKATRHDASEAGALGAVVGAMSAHTAHAGVQEQACWALCNICAGTDAAGHARKQQAAEAGALSAVVGAMGAHAAHAGVQEQACWALRNICAGADAAGHTRKQQAAEAGALGAVVGAMRAHAAHAGVQEQACAALRNICAGDDAAGRARAQQAAEAGALGAVVGAMRAHAAHAGVQEQACAALRNICAGDDAAGRARAQQVAEAGALGAVVSAMGAHTAHAGVQEQACAALHIICWGTDAASIARKQQAAEAGALGAVVGAMGAHAAHAGVQQYGC